MLGSEIIEVAIGLILIFLLVSIICSAVREGVESWLKTRAAYLERGIRELLHDREGRGLARSFYEHPMVYGLYSGRYSPGKTTEKPKIMARGGSLPSYIPAGVFANTIMDIAARGADHQLGSDLDSPRVTLENIRRNILDIDNAPVRRVLLNAVDSAHGDLDRAREYLQSWYDGGMDRVSGWYKRSTQKVLFGIGLFVAVSLNINTLTLMDYLYRHDAEREALVARAEAAAADTARIRSLDYAGARASLDSLRLPIGWGRGLSDVSWRKPVATTAAATPPLAPAAPPPAAAPQPATDQATDFDFWVLLLWLLASVPGWVLTGLAATMGAPFWFDILNKVMVIRSTVKPREKSQEEGSEDRQPKKGKAGDETAPPPPPPSTFIEVNALPPAGATPPPTPEDEPREHGVKPEERDGCDVEITRVTRDEDLPAAVGGVS